MNNTPFIHLFKSRYSYYFYDVNTNEIVSISANTYSYLKKIISNIDSSQLYTNDVQREVDNLKLLGYLNDKRPFIVEMQDTDNLEYYLNNRLSKLTLQVTQQCNFRCSYCHFTSGDDLNYHSHKPKKMSWVTAKKAIDFFASRTRDAISINIGFYGGEPLLEYQLIKKCIKYINSLFEGKVIAYSMTTNGALLTVEKVKYLINNGMSIFVSLDGPRVVHDKNRKKAGDGTGTFNDIYNNLLKIKKELPEYYNRISYNSVIDPENNCDMIDDFFSKELFSNVLVQTDLVVPNDTKMLKYTNEYINSYNKNYLLALLAKLNIIKSSQLNKIALNHYNSIIASENNIKPMTEIPDKIGHSGPCKPGVERLFVTIEGELFPCEKLKDSSDVMKIGSLEEGFYIEKVKNIYNMNYITKDKCKKCWNILKCTVCPTMINDGEKLSDKLCEIACKRACSSTEHILRRDVAIREVQEMISNIKEC